MVTSERVHIETAGGHFDLEFAWVGPQDAAAPVIVFLHEGLGSLATWKDFPEQLCGRLNRRGLIYSRFGYGRSTPRLQNAPFPVDYLHREALEMLPAVLDAFGLEQPWLFGHSDGGTIALLAAAHLPGRVRGMVIEAPHIFMENAIVTGVEKTYRAYLEGELRTQLARYHDDVDSVFYGWLIWLDPAYRAWNIEEEIGAVRCPVLAVQGEDDEYATLEQVYGIQRRVPQTRVLVLPHCGHSPHRDQPDAIIEATTAFLSEHER